MLRAARDPLAVDAAAAELALARGLDRRLDAAIDDVRHRLAAVVGPDLSDAQLGARRLIERLALTLQAALLVRYAPPVVTEAFVASRLDGDRGATFGTLGGTGAGPARAIVDRAFRL